MARIAPMAPKRAQEERNASSWIVHFVCTSSFIERCTKFATEPKVIATLDYLVFAMANAELLFRSKRELLKRISTQHSLVCSSSHLSSPAGGGNRVRTREQFSIATIRLTPLRS